MKELLVHPPQDECLLLRSKAHHKKVEVANIQFGPNLDVRHPKPFWVLCDIQIAPADIQFQKSGCQTSTMNFGIGCPHSLSWNWMSNSSHFKNGCQTFWMSHFDNGCQLFQKWMSHFKNGSFFLETIGTPRL